jgi:hypothetical protein
LNCDTDGVVISSDGFSSLNAGGVDGLLKIENDISLLQSVGTNFRLFLRDSLLDAGHFIVWVNIDVKSLSAKLNVDLDGAEVSDNSGTSFDSSGVDGLGLIERLTALEELVAADGNSFFLLDLVFDGSDFAVRIN